MFKRLPNIAVSRSSLLGASKLSSALVWGLSASAQQNDKCYDAIAPQPEDCHRADVGLTVVMPTVENTEKVDRSPGGNFEDVGFSISIDDETIAGASAPA